MIVSFTIFWYMLICVHIFICGRHFNVSFKPTRNRYNIIFFIKYLQFSPIINHLFPYWINFSLLSRWIWNRASRYIWFVNANRTWWRRCYIWKMASWRWLNLYFLFSPFSFLCRRRCFSFLFLRVVVLGGFDFCFLKYRLIVLFQWWCLESRLTSTPCCHINMLSRGYRSKKDSCLSR